MTTRRINRLTLLMLVVGFGAALVVYFTAPAPATEFDSQKRDQRESKKYVHDVRMMGGNTDLVADGLADWFFSLWQGETLAGTLVVITVAVIMIFRFVASHPDHSADP